MNNYLFLLLFVKILKLNYNSIFLLDNFKESLLIDNTEVHRAKLLYLLTIRIC
jgi:hypothetical protein